MDRADAKALIDKNAVETASMPEAVRELIMRALTGRDSDGNAAPLLVMSARFEGDFAYQAGTNGVLEIPEGHRVVGIGARAPTNATATVQIDDGDVVQMEAGGPFSVSPEGKLTHPSEIKFTGTAYYFVEYVVLSSALEVD